MGGCSIGNSVGAGQREEGRLDALKGQGAAYKVHQLSVNVNRILWRTSKGPQHYPFFGISGEHHPLAVAAANN
jgi:hypothetical protein